MDTNSISCVTIKMFKESTPDKKAQSCSIQTVSLLELVLNAQYHGCCYLQFHSTSTSNMISVSPPHILSTLKEKIWNNCPNNFYQQQNNPKMHKKLLAHSYIKSSHENGKANHNFSFNQNKRKLVTTTQNVREIKSNYFDYFIF